jgi:hypothetical protein
MARARVPRPTKPSGQPVDLCHPAVAREAHGDKGGSVGARRIPVPGPRPRSDREVTMNTHSTLAVALTTPVLPVPAAAATSPAPRHPSCCASPDGRRQAVATGPMVARVGTFGPGL